MIMVTGNKKVHGKEIHSGMLDVLEKADLKGWIAKQPKLKIPKDTKVYVPGDEYVGFGMGRSFSPALETIPYESKDISKKTHKAAQHSSHLAEHREKRHLAKQTKAYSARVSYFAAHHLVKKHHPKTQVAEKNHAKHRHSAAPKSGSVTYSAFGPNPGANFLPPFSNVGEVYGAWKRGEIDLNGAIVSLGLNNFFRT